MSKTTTSFTKEIFEANRPLILYGVSMYGELAYHVLRQWGIEITCFVDGIYETCEFSNLPVIRPLELTQYPNAQVLICGAQSFANIEDILAKNKGITYYDICELLQEYQSGHHYLEGESKYIYGDLNLKELCDKYDYYAGVQNEYDSKVVLPYCVLCITNKCSLNCRKCAAFVPYYKKHDDYTFDYVKQVFGKMLEVVDGIDELELMGGEPLLNKEFDLILEWCCSQKKIHAVKIVSNGTIIPNHHTVSLLRHEKVRLVLDNYGKLSNRLEEILKLAKKEKVRYTIQNLNQWIDLEPINYKSKSSEELKKIFGNCQFRHCIGVTNGRFFRCNVAAHMDELHLVPDIPTEYVTLKNSTLSYDELYKEIKGLLGRQYLHYCNYCNAGQGVIIPVAEQI